MSDIYLDNNATTQPLAEVVERVSKVLAQSYGNPSSPHRQGSFPRQILNEARIQVAELVGSAENTTIFTSGGTEANNLVIKSLCRKGDARLVTSAIEHSSTLKAAEHLQDLGVSVDVLPVDKFGMINPATLKKALELPASLVSIQFANSETGTLQPVEQLGEICIKHEVPFHVDAAQAVGRIPIDLKSLPIDYLTFTAHKIHGPKGAGAVAAKNLDALEPIFHGGDQELGVRPGTENVPGISGFGIAAQMRKQSMPDCIDTLNDLRNAFERLVVKTVPCAWVNGNVISRVSNTTNICFPGVDGIAMMANLDAVGICCSLTSACVSARPEPSHVLLAMGLSEDQAYSSLRFSFSVLNSAEDAKIAAEKVCEIYNRLARREKRLA